MNELIPITYANDRPAVSARELHKFLEVKTKFQDWFPRMTEYGFAEGIDFDPLKIENVPSQKRERTYSATDYVLTIDMAKELCMIQRTERGKQARQYFLTVENAWNSPQQVMARALQIANKQLASVKSDNKMLTAKSAQQEQILNELKPKANYVDMILDNHGLVAITQIAKDYGMTGTEMNKLLHEKGIQYKTCNGQWLLYKKYQSFGYTQSKTHDFKHKDGTPDIAMHTCWTQKGRLFLYDTLKKDGILPAIERS